MPTSRVLFFTKNARERVWFFFHQNAREWVCFEQRVYYLTTILENVPPYVPFFSNFVHKRVHFAKICKENSIFFTNILQEEGRHFFKKIARKRVLFRRPRWHTRVQKLRKCPPPGDCPTMFHTAAVRPRRSGPSILHNTSLNRC